MKYTVTLHFDSYEEVEAARDLLNSIITEPYMKEHMSACDKTRLGNLRNQISVLPRLDKHGVFHYKGYEFELNDCRFDGSYTDKVVCFEHNYDENGDQHDTLINWYSYGADEVINGNAEVPYSLIQAINKAKGFENEE